MTKLKGDVSTGRPSPPDRVRGRLQPSPSGRGRKRRAGSGGPSGGAGWFWAGFGDQGRRLDSPSASSGQAPSANSGQAPSASSGQAHHAPGRGRVGAAGAGIGVAGTGGWFGSPSTNRGAVRRAADGRNEAEEWQERYQHQGEPAESIWGWVARLTRLVYTLCRQAARRGEGGESGKDGGVAWGRLPGRPSPPDHVRGRLQPSPSGRGRKRRAACGGLLTAWRGCWGWQPPSSQPSPSRAKEEERHSPVGVPGHGGGFGAMRPRGPRQSIPFRIAW